MGYLSYIIPARNMLFKDRNATGAEEALKPHLSTPQTPEEKRAVWELMGLILRAQKRFDEAQQIYDEIADYYQAGYCALLTGNLHQVQQYWTKVLLERQNHWCVSLYGMATNQVRTFPTLFQVRNHMESDIANLAAANQLTFLENLLMHVDFLTQFNLEAPKFAGRALMHAGMLDRAGPYLLKGQKTLPNDPEIYFHLGQFSMAQQHFKEARLMLKQCLLISPTYSPAQELLEQVPESA